MACYGACGMKRERRSKADTWWWNEELKEAVSRRKDAHRQCVRTVLRRISGGIKA